MTHILIATSNPGKLRDFAAAASLSGISVAALPNFASLPEVEEDGATFEANAHKKAEFYSLHAAGELVLADDSGLEVSALNGAPGVRSARYAADDRTGSPNELEKIDHANNARLFREMKNIPDGQRAAKFVCVLAAAKDGKVVRTVFGEVHGTILRAPRGSNGFGYDPLFLIEKLGKTTAELSPQEKAAISHRGRAFRKFLDWYASKKNKPVHKTTT